MGKDNYEYKGLLASSWDFHRGQNPDFPDKPYYIKKIRESGQPVLVVGCGTGRLPLALHNLGIDADGLDVSPEMLEILRKKAIEQGIELIVYEQAMEAMNLQRKYQTIIVPSMSFQLVTELKSAQITLENFYRNFLPGGLLIMAIWHLDNPERGSEWGDWWQVFEKEGWENGTTLRRWERSKYDAKTELRHTQNRYEVWDKEELQYEESHVRSPELRSYSIEKISEMLTDTGFINVHCIATETEEPATDEDSVFYVLGSR